MALQITILDRPQLQNGATPIAPMLRSKEAMAAAGGQPAQLVTLGQQSAKITGPVLLILTPAEDTRIELTSTVTYAAPATTAQMLPAKVPQSFLVDKGDWYINAVAA